MAKAKDMKMKNVTVKTSTCVRPGQGWMTFVAAATVLSCATGAQSWSDAREKRVAVRSMRDWTVIVGDDATACEKYAADEFRQFFEKITRIQLKVRSKATAHTGNIFIGPSDPLRVSRLGFVMKRRYGDEELRIVVRDKNVAIVGGRPRGTLYGVYTFLEDYLGVRFLTAEVTHTPKLGADHGIPLIDRSYKPPFGYRFYLKTEVMKDPAFAARRRQNTAGQNSPKQQRLGKKLGGEAMGGVFLHNNFQLPVSFNDHPEYYSFRDGRRVPQQPCLSHPEVRRIITQHLLTHLKGYGAGTTIPLAQNDNDGACLCQRCAAVQREGDAAGSFSLPKALATSAKNLRNGPPSAVVIDFVNHVADAIHKRRPDLWIGTEAYAYTMMPPRKTKVRKNVKVQVATYHCSILYSLEDPRSSVNQQFLQYLTGWRKACDNLFIWTYDMNSREYWLPFPNLRTQGPNLRTFARNHGRGIFMQGHGANTEFSDLRSYMMTALIWDPSKDADKLMSEFLRLYYGRAAQPIRQWIDLIHDQAEASKSQTNINSHAKGYGLDAALGERGLALFAKAMKLAENDAVRSRVEKISVTALRLALEPAWWNAIEAPRRVRILKTNLQKERVPIDEQDLQRYRRLARRLFALAEKHNMHQYYEGGSRSTARKLVFSYLKMPQEEEETKK